MSIGKQFAAISNMIRDYCAKSPKQVHEFLIIKGSGAQSGVPKWKCKYCNTKTKSS